MAVADPASPGAAAYIGPAVLVQNVIRKCVVFIGEGGDEDFKPRGTGFVLSHGGAFYIATARHVVAGLASLGQDLSGPISIRLNKEGGGTACAQSKFTDWRFHPHEHNEATDVAVLPVPWLLRTEYIFAHIPGMSAAELDTLLAAFAVGVGDEVFTAGLFTNHHGQSKNIPVVRIGTIALMPDEPIKSKVGYLNAYLIEARSIAGLSGSPVFVHFHPFRSWGKGQDAKVIPVGQHGGILIGVMQGHFDVEGVDAVLEEDILPSGKTRRVGIHTGLGVVVPAQRLAELLESIAPTMARA